MGVCGVDFVYRTGGNFELLGGSIAIGGRLPGVYKSCWENEVEGIRARQDIIAVGEGRRRRGGDSGGVQAPTAWGNGRGRCWRVHGESSCESCDCYDGTSGVKHRSVGV